MKREPPSGAELLQVAGEVLRRDLLEYIPESRRYEALMVLRAMAIAQRELENGEGPLSEERRELEEILGTEVHEQIEGLNATLVRAIRRGDYDPPGEERTRVRAFLLDSNRRRLEETNPRYLARDD